MLASSKAEPAALMTSQRVSCCYCCCPERKEAVQNSPQPLREYTAPHTSTTGSLSMTCISLYYHGLLQAETTSPYKKEAKNIRLPCRLVLLHTAATRSAYKIGSKTYMPFACTTTLCCKLKLALLARKTIRLLRCLVRSLYVVSHKLQSHGAVTKSW